MTRGSPMTARVPSKRSCRRKAFRRRPVAAGGARRILRRTCATTPTSAARWLNDLRGVTNSVTPCASGSCRRSGPPVPRGVCPTAVQRHRALSPLLERIRRNCRPVVRVPGPQLNAFQNLQRAFVEWVDSTFGAIGSQDPASWKSERLEYEARLGAASEASDDASLDLESTSLARLEGAFDLCARSRLAAGTPSRPQPNSISRSLLPIHVGLRHAERTLVDFESGETDYAATCAPIVATLRSSW